MESQELTQEAKIESVTQPETSDFDVEHIKVIQEAAEKSKKEESKNPAKLEELMGQIEKEFQDSAPDKKQDSQGSVNNIDRSKIEAEPRLIEMLTGNKVNLTIEQYVVQNLGLDIDKLNQGIQADKQNIPELEGVTGVRQIGLEDGSSGYIVKVRKDYWPGIGPGTSSSRTGTRVAMIIDGFSKRAEELITNHEVYHLNHHRPEQLLKMTKEQIDSIESETVKNTGGIWGVARVWGEVALNIPSKIKSLVNNYKILSK